MRQIQDSELPRHSAWLGTDWQNASQFDKALGRLIDEAEVEVVFVKTTHFTHDGALEQWSKDYYMV